MPSKLQYCVYVLLSVHDGNLYVGFTTDLRRRLMGENDVVILKTISPPSMSEFDTIVTRARRQAKAAGMKPSDIARAVAKVRGRA